ncbi:MAG: hypothetical protein LC105_05595 [Chitinophagales bacterium]|nr:hypothetical protein [Chitinophagales bacterium]MCZ2393307.1 hypothetical protein [Chitinophagales bacterium]
MKPKYQEIIEELNELNAYFLQKGKRVHSLSGMEEELNERFYNSVFENIEKSEKEKGKLVTIHQGHSFLLRYMAIASSVVLFIITGVAYTLFSQHIESKQDSLNQLISKTSSQNIINYLSEEAMLTDEDFLWENIDYQNIDSPYLN